MTTSTRLASILALTLAASSGCSSFEGPPATGQTASALDQTVLGTAQSFTVLAGSTVTNSGPTTIAGNLGVSPGLAITGFPPGLVTGGLTHAGDAVALQAQNDITTAYTTLALQTPATDLTGQDLGNRTLAPGTYRFTSSAQLTGTLTLDAAGDPAAVFVFLISSTLVTASNASVQVINSGDDCNVFWQVGSSATLGTGTTFTGNILALTSITLVTGAEVSGRVLARNGAVTLDGNDVSTLQCGLPAGPGADAGVGPMIDAPPVPTPDAATPDAPLPPDAAPTPDAHGPCCGNGIIETGETCDDGNTTGGDGCSSVCLVSAPH
jgi:cysteine-rich repeat protein